MEQINISKDFSVTPGPRYKWQGKFSAEEFMENHLLNKFEITMAANSILTVVLDGTAGYATSFLEGSFGELQRKHPEKKIEKMIEFISIEEPYLIEEITEYILDARK